MALDGTGNGRMPNSKMQSAPIVEYVKLIPDYLRAVISWPLVVVFVVVLFRKEIRGILSRVMELLERIKKVGVSSLSVELVDRLRGESARKISQDDNRPLELSVSEGGYSNDYRAIIVVASIANRGEKEEQVISWKLSFPSERIELEPSAAPSNTLPAIPWWPTPTADIPANKLTQGTLFFRGRGGLQTGLPREPLVGNLTAETLHGDRLSSDVEVYKLSTLQKRFDRSYKVIRREPGKPEFITFFPGDSSVVDVVRWSESEGYKVMSHEIKETPEDEKHIATITVVVEREARAAAPPRTTS